MRSHEADISNCQKPILLNHRFLTIIVALTLSLHLSSGLADNLPTSRRAEKAMKRVTPALQQELADASMSLGTPVFIRVFKEEMELEVWLKGDNQYRLFKTYPVCTYGGAGIGPKTLYGDGKAPEGFYYVKPLQLNPYSQFHLSFNLGYPNRYDRHHKRTGSALMVHGECVSIGCFAMTNSSIEEIYTLVYSAFKEGQPFFRVHIFPFHMTEKAMANHQNDYWNSFWENLKEGYDWFEQDGFKPPNVEVKNGRYIFNSSY